jgi:glutathione synthase/RimK-type ligase-like ATP-grasp enzyme
MKIAILRCQNLPSFVTWEIPNVDALFSDDHALIDSFTRRGVDASSVVWRDPAIDWNAFDVALIRSTWDYVDDRDGFISSLGRIDASRCRLFNPLDAVRWNSDKSYLLDLERWGVPTVPTYRASSLDPDAWTERAARDGWSGAVVKPVVGTGGAHVQRLTADQIPAALKSLAADQPGREFFIQPMIESVISEGEWSYAYFGGELSHTLLKRPAAGDYRAHGIYGGTVEAAAPDAQDILQADAIQKSLPFDLLYVRLDLVRIDGRLSIMELELIEPILYLHLAPGGASKLVDATLARA